MAQNNRNSGKPWKPAEVSQLAKLADQNTPTRVISLKPRSNTGSNKDWLLQKTLA